VAPNRVTALAPILAAALIFFALLRGEGSEPGARTATPGPAQVAAPTRTRAPAALATSARRFLHAFLAYEVGARPPHNVAALEATATTSFAHELASARQTAATHPSALARLGPLTLNPLAGKPPLALVTATARRPAGPEQLSFLFTKRGGRWLASAPGE
jgi:hypothetical protein